MYFGSQFGDQSGVPLSKKITNLEATTHALNEETMAAMLNDPETSSVLKKVFAHSKLEKSKDRSRPAKPEEDGFETKIAKEGRDLGYKKGMEDSKDYLDLDDTQVQRTFDERIEDYLSENLPKEYGEPQRTWYKNGFKKGYESGVNVPIKKLNCGYDDGIAFVDNVRQKLGENIHYTKETRPQIENFVRPYLNDINNIPEKYRGMLYKRWYVESFLRAVKDKLRPVIKDEEGGTTTGDVNNILRHILARLVEFLYISVYRETTFGEIFKNADPNVFLEAVGITKEDFETLNKYHVFEENILNHYIHEFFVNESLGETLDPDSDEVHSQYRNSFGWFGFNDAAALQGEVRKYVNARQSQELLEEIHFYEETSPNLETKAESSSQEEVGENASASQNSAVTEKAADIVANVSLKDRIIAVLRENPKGLPSRKIASLLHVSKKEVNRTLYADKNSFEQVFLSWRLKMK